jgi:O-antigen/teichoic acid export membrane protein
MSTSSQRSPADSGTKAADPLNIGRAFSIGVIASAINAVGGLVRTRVVATVLGVSGVGITSEMTQIVGTLMTPTTIVNVPLVAAIAREKHGDVGPTDAQAAWDSSVTLALAVTVLAVAGVWLGAAYVAPPEWGPFGAVGLALSAFAGGAVAIGGLGLQALAAVTALREHAVVSAITLAITVAVVGVATWLYGLIGFFVGSAAAALVPIVALPFVLRKVGVPFSPFGRLRITRRFAIDAFRLGVPALAAAFTGQAAMTYLREYLRIHLGTEAGGYFQASVSFDTLVVASTLQTLGNFVFPRYAAARTPEALRAEILSAGDFVMRIMPPGVLIGIGLRAWILRVLYGSAFASAETILGLYLVADIARSIAWTQGGALMYRERMGVFVGANALFWGAFLVNVHLLAPRLELTGIGLAYLGGVVVHGLVTGLGVSYALGVALPVSRYLRWLAATAVAGGALVVAQRVPGADVVVVLTGIAWSWSNGTLRDGYRYVLDRVRGRMQRA